MFILSVVITVRFGRKLGVQIDVHQLGRRSEGMVTGLYLLVYEHVIVYFEVHSGLPSSDKW